MFKTLENPKNEGPGFARANAPACILERFGKTLFCELINRTKGMDKHTLLKTKVAEMVRILEARAAAGALVPSPGDVVLHLRLGDVVKGPGCWNASANKTGGKGGPEDCRWPYVLPGTCYRWIPGRVPPNATIIIVTSIQHSTSDAEASNSCGYLESMVGFLVEQGYQVHVRLDRLADLDTIYMGMASKLIYAGGGFSFMMSQFVDKRTELLTRSQAESQAQRSGTVAGKDATESSSFSSAERWTDSALRRPLECPGNPPDVYETYAEAKAAVDELR